VLVLRRLTALLAALLLFQADWQGSGAACLVGHAASHGGSNGVPAAATGAEAGAQAAPAMAHDGMIVVASTHRAPNEARAVPASPSTGGEETAPSHCPDSGMPADCAAMMACSAAAVSTAAGPLLATDGRQVGERVSEPDARPHSRVAAPDVPPPRA
jgi:hypothetical protein